MRDRVTRYFVDIGQETFQVDVSGEGVLIDGERVEAELMRVEGTDTWSLLLGGGSHRIVAGGLGSGRWELRVGGTSHTASVMDQRTRHIQELTGGEEGPKGPTPVRAPMPGLVLRIEVSEGDVVHEGQGVAIVEAMKMENELKADSRARVARVYATEGQVVEKDQVLIDLEPMPDDEAEA